MRRTTIFFIFFLCFTSILGGGYIFSKNKEYFTQKKELTSTGIIHATGSIVQEVGENTDPSDVVGQKIAALKKRHAWKGVIQEGDMFYENGELSLAMKQYITVYKANPHDPLILEKLGDTYIAMKKFDTALNYYKKIISPSISLQKKVFLTQWNASNLTDIEHRNSLKNEILASKFSKTESWYYNNTLFCSENFGECIKNFEDYFQVQKTESGSLETYDKLKEIEQSLESYKHFQIEDISLKKAFLIGTWYSQGLYSLSLMLSEELLKEKKDYKPILKIAAQSAYELGRYEDSKKFLIQYTEIDQKDPKVYYLLGRVHSMLRDYVLSNIAYQKSLELGYEPRIDARRNIIYNFALLDNTENLLAAFGDFIRLEENEYQEQDLGLAIYYHIVYEKYALALEWIQKGYKKYPESSHFYAYEGWILREQKKYKQSEEVLSNGIKKDPKNVFLLMQLAYTFLEQKNTDSAKIYFDEVIKLAKETDYGKQAQLELQTIQNTQQEGFFN